MFPLLGHRVPLSEKEWAAICHAIFLLYYTGYSKCNKLQTARAADSRALTVQSIVYKGTKGFCRD